MDELPPQRLEELIGEVTNSLGINTDLDMQEFEDIDKALTRIQGELKREQGKLAEIETNSDLKVHKERVKEKIADLKEERAARLELLAQNRKELAS